MGGVVDPQDTAGPEAVVLVLAGILALLIFGSILYFVVGVLKSFFTGGLTKVKHEWWSSAGSCNQCSKPICFKVEMRPLTPTQTVTHYSYVCEEHVLQYDDYRVTEMSDSEVRAHAQRKRKAARDAKIERNKRMRESNY